MNEKVKKIFIAIGSAIGGFFALLLGGLLFNRRRTTDVGAELGKSEAAVGDARETVINAKDTVESLGSTTNNIKSSVNECTDILAAVRKRGPKK